VLNNPLRFPDEFVRHKILDAVGDLALLGKPLLGHLVAVRAGHELHAELMRHLSASEGCWEHTTEEEPLEEVALAGARAPSTVS
jgi:UDP-3-O-[3-hydroxymyristoyl] N-acetylglucosamine deacetylase